MFLALIGIVLGCGPVPDKNKTALIEAIKAGDDTAVSHLIANDPLLMESDLWGDPRFHFTPLSLAAANGQYKICSNLLSAGANVNPQDKSGYTPLHWAAQWASSNGDTNLVLLLLQHGADPTKKGEHGHTALWVATNNTTCPESLRDLLLKSQSLSTNR